MRKVIGILVAGVMIGGYIWYMFSDEKPTNHSSENTTSHSETTTSQKKTAVETPPLSSKEPKASDEKDKVDVPMPPVKVIKGVSEITAPDPANKIAGKFHWLFYLDGPTISSDARQQEIKKLVEPTVLDQIEGQLVRQRKQTQKWKTILVSVTHKEADGYWFNTVCLVNGEQTDLYFKVGKEEIGWRVQELLIQ